MTSKKMGQPVKNKHKVPSRQWDKWSNHAKKTFNDMMHQLRPTMQFAFLHPHVVAVPAKYWDTTRWNVAWAAACVADRTPITKVVNV